MNVIILCAGIGSRLRPYTDKIPKCMIKINETPLIETIISQFKNHQEVDEIFVVVGYKKNILIKALEKLDVNIVVNHDYENTNNMYSFFLATLGMKKFDNYIIVNGDCRYDDEIIKMIVNTNESTILADKNFCSEESMKVKAKNGCAIGLSKKFNYSEFVFTSIDLYRFIGAPAKELIEQTKNIINKGEVNSWTEVAIDKLLKTCSIKVKIKLFEKLKWYEIDTLEDLNYTRKIFSNG